MRSIAAIVFGLGCLLLSDSAFALGTCGSGGETGDQVMVEFDGSVYYVTTPAGVEDGTAWPLIVGLHGDEGDPADSVNWNWKTVPDGTFIFVAPKAHNADGSWYMAIEENEMWMDALMESLYAKYNIDIDRVYIWGLSGGAEFISGYATARHDVFAAAQWNMGGSNWLWIQAGSPSPEGCKIPARFVVSPTDFLLEGAMNLYSSLTDKGHETYWLDADCMGHCWDDVEAGVGARDWLLGYTLCGETTAPGCLGVDDPNPPPPEPEPEPDPAPEPAPAPPPPAMTMPPMEPPPQSPPTAGANGAEPALAIEMGTGPGEESQGTVEHPGGCAVATTDASHKGAWLLLTLLRRRRQRP